GLKSTLAASCLAAFAAVVRVGRSDESSRFRRPVRTSINAGTIRALPKASERGGRSYACGRDGAAALGARHSQLWRFKRRKTQRASEWPTASGDSQTSAK